MSEKVTTDSVQQMKIKAEQERQERVTKESRTGFGQLGKKAFKWDYNEGKKK